MICKIFHRTVFFLAALACLQLTSCGGGGGGDGEDENANGADGEVRDSLLDFMYAHREYFEDRTFSGQIYSLLCGTDLPSSGRTYYISPDGTSSVPGVSSANVFFQFSDALERMTAGDTLIVMDGTYDSINDVNFEVRKTGNSSNYIKIKAMNRGKAIISGGWSENYNRTQEDDYALMSIKGSYIMVDGLSFKDLRADGGTGISLENGSNHIVISNCEFENIGTCELASDSNHATANAIIGYGDDEDKPISSILVYNNTCRNMETGWGECISLTENCKYVYVIGNNLDNTGNIGIDVGGNYVYELPEESRFTRYAYIAHNTVANESTEDTYGDTCYGIYADGGQHIHIANNTVKNCMGGIEAGAEQVNPLYSTADIWISGNKIIDCQEVYFACGGWRRDLGLVDNVHFTENTCTATRDAGSMVNLAKCDNVEIKRNTFKSVGNFGITKVYREYSGWNLNPTPNVNDVENENTWIGF